MLASLVLKTAFVLILVLSLGELAIAQIPERGEKAISKVKNFSSRRLDRRLPDVTFSSWLEKNVGSRDSTEWEIHDCGEQDGSGRQKDFPICVGATVKTRDEIVVDIFIVVGCHKHGIQGKPKVWGVWVYAPDRRKFEFDELSQITPQLRRLRK